MRLIGFLTGVGAGIGVGMLLAPRTGEKTRKMIRGKANEGAAYLRDRGNEVRDAAAEAIRDSTRKVAKGTEAVRAAVDAGRQAYSDTIRS
ncbi:MAG: Late embryosis abundant protein [Bryobacterales bacterium]|jgi:gas vesicle protein|nr:Late embryosis abundant protein [Bryobacterales bacterium]